MNELFRGSGKTTRAMQSAPYGALFLWLNDHLDYPKHLAKTLQREDLKIVGPSWIENGSWRGQRFSGLVLDPDVDLTNCQYHALCRLHENISYRGKTMNSTELTFARLRDISAKRAAHWHANTKWTASDWMTALVGEVGEAANVIKKLNRIRDGLPGNKPGVTEETLRTDLAKELADCQIYLDLLADAVGVNLADATVDKFNEVSDRLGFSDKL